MVRKTINQMLLVKFVMVLATISPWIKPIATFILTIPLIFFWIQAERKGIIMLMRNLR